MKKNFEGWITASTMLPQLINMNFNPRVSSERDTIFVKFINEDIFDFIPVEKHSEFTELVNDFINKFDNEFGISDKMNSHIGEPLGSQLLDELQHYLEYSLEEYLHIKGISFKEDLLYHLIGRPKLYLEFQTRI